MSYPKVYIVEDMAISRVALITTLEDNKYNVVGSAAHADKAWLEIKEKSIDVVLLDINLSGDRDGIWLASKIREKYTLPIIFLTAYGDTNTLESIKEVKPDGYLMKPFNNPTLLASLEIVLRTSQQKREILESIPVNKSIFIKERGQQVKVFLNDILFIKSEGNYIEIFQKDKKNIIRDKISSFLEKIASEEFKQVHRRYVVNISKIDGFSATALIIDGTKIPISQSFKNLIKDLKKEK